MLIDASILASDYIGTTDTSQQEALDRICVRAQDIVEAYLHRKLEAVQHYQEKHDSVGEDHIYLNHKPIITIIELLVDGIAVDQEDIYIYEDRGLIDFDYDLAVGKQLISVTYWAGYVGDVLPPEIEDLVTPELPKVIEEAMYMTAHRLWLNSGLSGQARAGLASRSGDGGTTNFLEKILPPEMIVALAQYREIRL
jgi:hypothetical protein